MPVGTNGKAMLLLSGGIDSPVAGYMIAKRGVKIDAVYLTAMLKILGVTYLAEFAAAICKDAGYQTIAGQIEVFARLSILAIGMPILKALLLAIRELGQ